MSFFLFGPRSTEKSLLIAYQLGDAVVYDPLDAHVYRALVARPTILEERSSRINQVIVIDEIQKIPRSPKECSRA